MAEISRRQYAELYGPTVGDRFKLADTSLVCQVEQDLLTYGDELVFGGGKTARDGMGQASSVTNGNGALDLVITNVIVMDPLLGIIKADIGVKAGRIAGIGKSGNPGVMDGVDPAASIRVAPLHGDGAGPVAEIPGGQQLGRVDVLHVDRGVGGGRPLGFGPVRAVIGMGAAIDRDPASAPRLAVVSRTGSHVR